MLYRLDRYNSSIYQANGALSLRERTRVNYGKLHRPLSAFLMPYFLIFCAKAQLLGKEAVF